MKIFITIMGLIVQVNQPWSFDNTLVLIEAPGHQPRLSVPISAVMNPNDAWVKANTNGDTLTIDLTGATVRVKGTRGVFSDLTDDFMNSSPRMATIAPGCQLRPEVRRREILKGEIAAYVDFRGGKVEPDKYLKDQLSFNGGPAACAVCTVRYSADLRGDHVTLVYKKATETHEVLVRGGDSADAAQVPQIAITNVPPAAADAAGTTPPSHFRSEFNIYVDRCVAKQIVPAKGARCDKPVCPETVAQGSVNVAMPGYDCTVGQQP